MFFIGIRVLFQRPWFGFSNPARPTHGRLLVGGVNQFLLQVTELSCAE